MDSNQQNDGRMVTVPTGRLHDQVLAPERHDLFLSALAVVHRGRGLTGEEAERSAYLMMQTGDGDENSLGWVRLAMWSWVYNCCECRRVLGELETAEAVAALYARYTTDGLKGFKMGIQKEAKGLGWKGQRFYSLGNNRKADRSEASFSGFRVDWWLLMEEFKEQLLPSFRQVIETLEDMCTAKFRNGFLEKELDSMTIDPRWWSGGYSDAQLWAGVEGCFRCRVNPYSLLMDYVDRYGTLPFLEVMSQQRFSLPSDWPLSRRFRQLDSIGSLREFYRYLLGESTPFPCALTLQLKAASLGIGYLYFVDGEIASSGSMSLMPNEFYEPEIGRWLDDIAGDSGVVRFFKGCLPKALVVPA